MGGNYEKRQVSIVEGCQLVRKFDLSFDFYRGSCGVFNFDEERGNEVFLCFDSNESQTCYRYNGGTVFDKVGNDSQFGHNQAGNNLGQYNHGLIVVGGSDGPEVEVLNKENGILKWTKLQK